MKAVIAFSGGVFTLFAVLALLSVALSASGKLPGVPADDILLLLVWSVTWPAAMGVVAAIAFALGIKRFGSPSVSARLFLLGILCGLAIYVASIFLIPVQALLPESIHTVAQYLVVFLVCFFAASTARPKAG